MSLDPITIYPKVDTSILENGDIKLAVGVEIDNIYENLYTAVYNIAEKEFKEALIKLGWTPPKE